jgi:hypothetical protein
MSDTNRDAVMEAIQAANHYALDPAHVQSILQVVPSPLIQFLLDIYPSTALIQRNGSGVWFCRFGPCGGAAERPEAIAHSPYCPVAQIVRQRN